MKSADGWRTLPVWRCLSDICGQQWGSIGEDTTCPFCHLDAIKRTGFNCGDLADAQDEFGFQGEFPAHIPETIPDVVQLSSLQRDGWEGLPVFHPGAQIDDVPDWRTFDVGVVVAVEIDPIKAGQYRCEILVGFLGNCATFRYSASNLWVPETIAKKIAV